jgi:hypothetical protein
VFALFFQTQQLFHSVRVRFFHNVKERIALFVLSFAMTLFYWISQKSVNPDLSKKFFAEKTAC